ncbi:tyrosine-type recombinase/integrase [Pseudomonas sp. CGJS7]|uniref:tyrosine-type recombinase/integrase n=1 Tax=Pseudomonas sp. CGJS7 TaxID=3109348 RepID=UPI00300B386A
MQSSLALGDFPEAWAAAQEATGQAEKALKLARAALRRAVKQWTIRYSAMDGVSIQKPVTSRAPSYYRPADLRALAKASGDRASLWAFMTNTGIRRGEMAKVRRSDVRDGMLYVESAPKGRTKNLRWRAIPLNAAARLALADLGDDQLVSVHADTLTDWFSADAKEAKLAGSLHWLRHTFCTAMVQSGGSLHEVKRLAGHSSITVTEKYAHHMPDFGRAAVGAIGNWEDSWVLSAIARAR